MVEDVRERLYGDKAIGVERKSEVRGVRRTFIQLVEAVRRRLRSRAGMGVVGAGVLLFAVAGWRMGDLGGETAQQAVVPQVLSTATQRPTPKPTPRVTASPSANAVGGADSGACGHARAGYSSAADTT